MLRAELTSAGVAAVSRVANAALGAMSKGFVLKQPDLVMEPGTDAAEVVKKVKALF